MTTITLTRRDRLRRVVLLCCNVARNIAFYRAEWPERVLPLLPDNHPDEGFWRQANTNFLDVAVLDWCKLFGDQKDVPLPRVGKHHWRRVVRNPGEFETELFAATRLDHHGFAALITEMRSYRDGFVAHLDDGLVMKVPELDDAYEAVKYYHRHVAERDAQPGDLNGLPSPHQFLAGYQQCADEAARVYAARAARAA